MSQKFSSIRPVYDDISFDLIAHSNIQITEGSGDNCTFKWSNSNCAVYNDSKSPDQNSTSVKISSSNNNKPSYIELDIVDYTTLFKQNTLTLSGMYFSLATNITEQFAVLDVGYTDNTWVSYSSENFTKNNTWSEFKFTIKPLQYKNINRVKVYIYLSSLKSNNILYISNIILSNFQSKYTPPIIETKREPILL